MSRIIQDFHADESRVIDRLVDAELNEQERRELLPVLDEVPGAWRRCGLAFIESQLLHHDLRTLVDRDSRAALDGGGQVTMVASGGAPRGSWSVGLALAACVAAAFVLGYQSAPQRNRLEGGPALAAHEASRSSLDDATRGALDRTGPIRAGDESSERPTFVASTAGPDDASDPAWRTVELAVQDESLGRRSMRLPVVDLSRVDEQWLRSRQQQATLSPTLRAALQESGLRVQERPRLMPVELQDGSRIVFPVNQVEVGYDGGRAY